MKLSNQIKEGIEKKAVATAYNQIVEAAEQALANKCIEWLDANGFKRSSDIPEGFEKYISTTNAIRIPGEVYGHDPLRVPVSLCDPRYSSITLPDHVRTWPEYKAYFGAINERESFRKDVRAVLNACQTDKQLQDTAPELAALLPEPSQAAGALVAVETVNKVRQALSK